MPFIISLIPLLLKLEPEAAALIHELFGSGQTEPTAQQVADLQSARTARLQSDAALDAAAGIVPTANG